MAWAKNGTPDTLSSTADSLTISDLTAKKFNIVLFHVIQSGNISTKVRLDNDSGSVYANRWSGNGGADSTATSDTEIEMISNGNAWDKFGVMYICNIDGEETLSMGWLNFAGGAGAANDPERSENVGKDSGTTQFTRLDVVNTGAGSYATGSNLSALGSELTPASATTIETGSIYIDTDTNQRYFWNGSSWSLQA